MRFQKQVLVMAVLATFAALGYAGEAAKEPKSGKKCVTFMSSEVTNTGQTRMNYRNVCANSFQIRVQVGDNMREKGIEPGSPEKPSKAYITCKPEDRCEGAKWRYE